MGCGGNCGGCSGCARELVLTQREIDMLLKFAQIPFLPVARKMGDLTPVYLEENDLPQEEYSQILQCMEKKGLISLDFDKPLKGFDDSAYEGYPIRGSMALTERGQKVLEMLELQGIKEEICGIGKISIDECTFFGYNSFNIGSQAVKGRVRF